MKLPYSTFLFGTLILQCCLPTFVEKAEASQNMAAQSDKWEKMKDAWIRNKKDWEGQLSAKEAEIEKHRAETDSDAKLKEINENSKAIIEMTPTLIKQSLTGKTEKAATTAMKAAKDFIDERKALDSLIDIALDEDENNRKAEALQKEANALEANIAVAEKAISRSNEKIQKIVEANSILLQIKNTVNAAVTAARDALP